ncbi:MAG: glutamate-1-semialdehyde 2,1-aminomutase [Deltaproteobacteria bacterium]|nr:glutamate-1-semialdehyde 2,1-aminomutase [Deltaproteobacteria bacterium]
MRENSESLFKSARQIIPGGVNSPVRAYKAVGGTPPFICRGEGAFLFDADQNRYLDYIGSWGPMILGQAHPDVVKAVAEAAAKGTSFGAPCPQEIELARLIVDAYPHVEKIRMVSSGTEATMSAIRLARGFTGREKIIKFSGCYHGHADSLLVQAGSGAATLGVPSSPGIPKKLAEQTLTASYNSLDEVQQLVDEHENQIACIILEPIAGNMGCVPPEPGFLQGLRELATANAIVLIIDEVMTGFRVAWGGAQDLYGVNGDLVCLGKIIGGGLPVGAFGGREDIMSLLAPEGPVYQAGTLSGNPLAMCAGIRTLELVRDMSVYPLLEKKGRLLEAGITPYLEKYSDRLCLQRVGSMFCLYFTPGPVRSFNDALLCDTRAFSRYFHAMLQKGFMLPPSQFEANFISLAHSDRELERTVLAIGESLREIFSV